MEESYWWHRKNIERLENGDFHLHDKELEEKIGKLTISRPPWVGPGLIIRGTKAGSTEVYQVPRNCGHMIMGALSYGEDGATLQHFITKNFASMNGYSMIMASGDPEITKWFLKLGWELDAKQEKSSRYRVPLNYIHYEIPYSDMLVTGYGNGQIPATMYWQSNRSQKAETKPV